MWASKDKWESNLIPRLLTDVDSFVCCPRMDMTGIGGD